VHQGENEGEGAQRQQELHLSLGPVVLPTLWVWFCPLLCRREATAHRRRRRRELRLRRTGPWPRRKRPFLPRSRVISAASGDASAGVDAAPCRRSGS
jgi:hypothetical protein